MYLSFFLCDERIRTLIVNLNTINECEIIGITEDSRQVRPGYLFAALPGKKVDGREFLCEVVGLGVAAVLVPIGTSLSGLSSSVTVLESFCPRLCFSLLVSRFYQKQPRIIAAVTGTNGKTSTVHFVQQIWSMQGKKAASLGTLGLITPSTHYPNTLTTPSPEFLYKNLQTLQQDSIDHLALEASSHGLEQYRLDGISLRAAGFTNLTRDHLDYHPTFDDYRTAKLRLFSVILPQGGYAVFNLESPLIQTLKHISHQRKQPYLTYGWSSKADLAILQSLPTPQGQRLKVCIHGIERDIMLPLIGTFQAMNVMCAVGLVMSTEDFCTEQHKEMLDSLSSLKSVPGRLQYVGKQTNDSHIYIDYAHTPDALKTLLSTVRHHMSGNGRLVVVFGCGGDRDPGKRPLMGRIATKLADLVIVTDDNPRHESPVRIRQMILKTAPHALEIADRTEAIITALSLLQSDDVLIVAGKGHEQGQIIQNTVYPFDDANVIQKNIL